ncbi:MAG: zf-HC2 domain-containing protein, partial [Acidobacteriota bacterium]
DFYLNNELSLETNLAVIKHLEDCSRCAQVFEGGIHLKNLLRRAVRQEAASPMLQEKIQKSLRTQQSQVAWYSSWRNRVLAAAAALTLLLAGWLALRVWQQPLTSSTPLAVNQTPVIPSDRLLRVGLSTHIHCGLEWQESNASPSFEQMLPKLGSDFAGLLSLVKDKTPDFKIIEAHRCYNSEYRDQKFVHIILKKDQTLLSLIITDKNGAQLAKESLPAVLQAAGVSLYHTHQENFETVGFETEKYLAFIVSNLAKDDNLQIASSLAPSVRDFLVKLEG